MHNKSSTVPSALQDNGLWDQVYAAFEPHRLTDPNAQAALNRIAAKCLGLRFDRSTCSIRQESLSAEDLRTLKRYHQKTNPSSIREPIVVLEFRGQRLVIDGNKRVNKWIADGAREQRSAIIITLREMPKAARR